MAAVDAGWIGPDGLGGAYKNKAEVLQAETWYALGGTQGVLSGMTLAGVAGSMAIDIAAGAAMISRRDGSNNVQAKGYLLPVATTTRVTFGAASPSARNDALVAAVVDTSDGAVGTGALSVGGQLVAVPGVSGTSTPRTDAQIAAYLGRGGFVRLADVPIASTDTAINMANLTSVAVPLYDSGNITNVFTPGTGWSISSQSLRRRGGSTYFVLTVARTGADITVGTTGDIGNSTIVTWNATTWPFVMSGACAAGPAGRVASFYVQSGSISVNAVAGSANLLTGDSVSVIGYWLN